MKKFLSLLLAGLLLAGLSILAGCGGANSSSAEAEALRRQVAELQQQIQEMESGSGGSSTADPDLAELKRQIGVLNETIAALQTAVGNNADKAEVKQLKDQLASLQTRLTNSETRILLLEGKVDGDPNKVYHLGDTVSYSSNGMKLFEIKVYETGSYLYNLLVNMTYTNFNMAAKFSLDQIYTSILVEAEGNVNEQDSSFSSAKHIVPIGQTITLATGSDISPLTFKHNSWGTKKLYFGIYNKVDSKGSFIPFACYELEFTQPA